MKKLTENQLKSVTGGGFWREVECALMRVMCTVAYGDIENWDLECLLCAEYFIE